MSKMLIHGASVLLLGSFVLLALGSGTAEGSVQNEGNKGLNINDVQFDYIEIPFLDLSQSIKAIDEPGHGFIVDAYFGGDSDYLTICDTPIANMFDRPKNSIRIRNGIYGSSWDDLEKRYDKNIICKIYIKTWSSSFSYGRGELDPFGIVVRIEGLLTPEQARAKRAAEEEAERLAEEEAKQVEQERLANLYRQAGNNLGNLRNASKRYGTAFGRDYYTTIYNFGDGNYIREFQNIYGDLNNTGTGTYRVNGDTVIFLSSSGTYSYGTIVGTALNIGGDIYR